MEKKIIISRLHILLILYGFQSICGGISFYIALFLKASTSLNVYQIGGVISAIAIGNIIGAFSGGYLLDKINAF